jgi:oligopeptide/dipeptide ABC transporter ATP-binding protein
MAERLLDVRDLEVLFRTEAGIVRAVDGISLTLDRGEVLAIVGESGCGKSTAVMTLMGLTRSPNASFAGSAHLRAAGGAGLELIGADERTLRRLRGSELAMVFQDPMSAMNPVLRVGDQIAEQILAHEEVSREAADERAIELLDRVGVPHPAERARSYPHELSGGMRQRAMIAMALSCEPSVLIADEPTTALDVTVQAQVLGRIRELRERLNGGVILVTHDLGAVAELADRVAVMYAGRIVEHAEVDALFHDPQHPYTWGLLGSRARLDRPRPARLPAIPGQPPSLLTPPTGCHFRPRCPHAFASCVEPPLLTHRGGHSAAHLDRCFLYPERKRALRGGATGLASP